MARGCGTDGAIRGVGGTGRLYQQLGRLERENAALRDQVDRLQHANQQFQARVRTLTGKVEEPRRAAKRQAAPFSKNTSTPRPRRPGRKPARAHGRSARRLVLQRVDRVVAVGPAGGLPARRRAAGGGRVACQDQEDRPAPRSAVGARYRVQVGRCLGCRGALEPRIRACVASRRRGAER